MLTDGQLLCLCGSAGALVLASAWGLGDLACRLVGGPETPAEPVDAFLALGRAAQAGIAAGVAAVGTLVGGLFGWAVRP